MKNKMGFVLIETIVTITVLAASLLYVYSSFNNILIKEKTRIHYDDVAYLYRTYYIKEFFKNYEIDYVLNLLNEENPIIIIGCDYEGMFGEDATAKSQCDDLIQGLNVSKIAVALNNFDYVKDCDNTSNKCLYLNNFSVEQRSYLQSLGKIDVNEEYVMIVEFLEGDESSDIVRNFSWIKIKEVEYEE